LFQVLQKINAPEFAPYALSARLDREGKLIIETTGLYQTKSFIWQDEKPFINENTLLSYEHLHYNPKENNYYYLSDYSVSTNTTFDAQTITLRLYDIEGTPLGSPQQITFNTSFTLQDIIDSLNNLDIDSDGISDFSSGIDSAGKLYIKLKDSLYQNLNKKILYFTLKSTGNFVN
ncbi:MAG: hypothetical protein ACK4GE_06660, partial [Caldimicrobium sp.]